MTTVWKTRRDTYEYHILEFLEKENKATVRYCSLEEVLYILSQKEGSINVQKLAD